jgi:cutinase
MHATIPQLSPQIQSQLVAGVLFGDTKNYQTSGTIKGFPSNKLKVFCAQDDGVCGGWLNVNPGHVSYNDRGDTEKAAEWLAAKFRGSQYH